MGRVTYLHHYVRHLQSSFDNMQVSLLTFHISLQLPTLWFAVLMMGHMLDTFVFQRSSRSNRARWIWFGLCAGSVFLCFMWFRGVAFGITGPIKDHRGLKWRKVSIGYWLGTGSALLLNMVIFMLGDPCLHSLGT